MSASVSPISTLPPLLFASALSIYGLYLSKENITRLQQYEKQSERAAEWSNTAAQRLHKTRTTQTSGTVTLLLSFLASTSLPFLPAFQTPTLLAATGLASGAMLWLSRTHMANFWNESTQTKIPFVEKFNDAVRGSEKVVWILGTLSLAWGSAGVVWAVNGGWLGTLVWAGVTGVRTVFMLNQGWGTSL